MSTVIFNKIQDQIQQEEQWKSVVDKLTNLVPDLLWEINKLKKENQVSKMELHFAFLFACPLVMMQTKKAVPQLNYDKEFTKIKERMECSWDIKYQKRQCTYETITEVLNKHPFGIHFSGHGIPKWQVRNGKDEGDYLLLETETCEGTLLSREKMKALVEKTKCDLEFVVVLTCHSQD